jgi:hypothetical protein
MSNKITRKFPAIRRELPGHRVLKITNKHPYSTKGAYAESRPPRTVAPTTSPALTRTKFLMMYCPSRVGT